jgi:hypothetical protein
MGSGTADPLQATDAAPSFFTGLHGFLEESPMETIPSSGPAKSHRELFGHTRLVKVLRNGHPRVGGMALDNFLRYATFT